MKNNMKISSGAKKDLLIIALANALLIVANSDDAKEDKDLTKLDNTSYKLNRRIDRRLNNLQAKLDETQKQFYIDIDSGEPRKLGMWVKSKLNSKFIKVMNGLSKETNLESLASQILFNNFCERDKPLHESFKWLAEPNQHHAVYDMIEQTIVGKITNSVYLDAVASIKIIKG